MAATPIFGLRFPAGSDSPNLPTIVGNLAADAEARMAHMFVTCTRATRPTSPAPAVGDRIYETDTGLYLTYNGTKWLMDELVRYMTADQLWTANTTFADVTPAFVWTVEASSKYVWESFISYEADSAADMKIMLRGPASMTARWGVAPSLASTTSNPNDVTFHAISTSLAPGWIIGGENAGVLVSTGFRGTATTAGTAGTFALQVAQNVSNANSTKIHQDSWMKFRQVA